MSELECKYKQSLSIIARKFYLISADELSIIKYEHGHFTISEKYKDYEICQYLLSLSDIEIIYEAMCDKIYGSIYSRDHWGMILEKAREMAKEQLKENVS